jgi:hypothetical protein
MRLNFKRIAKTSLTLLLVVIFSLNLASPAFAKGKIPKRPDPQWVELREQMISDLVGAGVSVAAALSGNVPLALMAGVLTKYVTTYGIMGVKAIISIFKGHPPEDLGEVNLAFIYVTQTKRMIYSALLQIREQAEKREQLEAATLKKQLDEVENLVTDFCKDGNCKPITLDEKYVQFNLLDLTFEAKSTPDLYRALSIHQIKNTYHYLLLLYMDVQIVEQELIQALTLNLAAQIDRLRDMLSNHPLLSNTEKELHYQRALGIALQWQKMSDEKRVDLSTVYEKSLDELNQRNRELQDQINTYPSSKNQKAGRK